jgi:hypothetical protein
MASSISFTLSNKPFCRWICEAVSIRSGSRRKSSCSQKNSGSETNHVRGRGEVNEKSRISGWTTAKKTGSTCKTAKPHTLKRRNSGDRHIDKHNWVEVDHESHTSTFALFAANSSNVRSRSGSDIRTMPGGMSFSASSCSLKKILFNEKQNRHA